MSIRVILRESILAVSFGNLENEATPARFLPKKACTFTILSMDSLIPRVEFLAKVISWLGLFIPVSTELSKASEKNKSRIEVVLLLPNSGPGPFHRQLLYDERLRFNRGHVWVLSP